MTWRTIAAIVLTFLVLSLCVWVTIQNRELLGESILFWTRADGSSIGLPVGQALLACLALGAGGVAAAWAVQSTRAAARRLDERKVGKRRRAQEEQLLAGQEDLGAGRTSAALQHFESVLEQEPMDPAALTGAADALRALGRPAEALELRERLLAERPGDASVLLSLAQDHRARGDLSLAAGALAQLLDRKPGDAASIARELLDLRLEQGDLDAALAAHDRWAKLAGNGAEVARERAAIETRRAARDAQEGRTREAISALRKVVKKHPDYAPASLALARALLLEGEEAGAMEVWLAGYELTREGAFLVAAEEHFLGPLEDDTDPIERASSALAAMKRFANCSGERPQAIAFLGKLQTRFEMLEEAAASFDSVRESFPDNPTFTYYAARIAEKRGRHETASEWYRGILKALDILRPTYRCRACDVESEAFADRCPACARWGSVSLDIGVKPLTAPLPAAHPVYAVRGEEPELDEEPPPAADLGEEQGRG